MSTFLVPPVYADVKLDEIFGPGKSFPTLGSLINIVLPNLLVIAGITAFIFVVVAGLKIIASAGSGDSKAIESNQKAFTYAILGLIIIFGAYFFIQIAETLLGYQLLIPNL